MYLQYPFGVNLCECIDAGMLLRPVKQSLRILDSRQLPAAKEVHGLGSSDFFNRLYGWDKITCNRAQGVTHTSPSS